MILFRSRYRVRDCGRVLVVLGMFLVAVACREGGARGTTSSTPEGNGRLSENGKTVAFLGTHPDPPKALEKTTFVVAFSSAPDEESRVVLDLSMPAMYHGENRPTCARTEGTEYLCTGYFVMGGAWEVAVEVDGTPLRTFTLNVRE